MPSQKPPFGLNLINICDVNDMTVNAINPETLCYVISDRQIDRKPGQGFVLTTERFENFFNHQQQLNMDHIATQEEISFNDEEVHKIVWQV